MAERYLVVTRGGASPRLVGPIEDDDRAVERALVSELKQNAALLGEHGEAPYFVLRIQWVRGRARLSVITHAAWYADACRARAHRDLGRDAAADALLASVRQRAPEAAAQAEAIANG